MKGKHIAGGLMLLAPFAGIIVLEGSKAAIALLATLVISAWLMAAVWLIVE